MKTLEGKEIGAFTQSFPALNFEDAMSYARRLEEKKKGQLQLYSLSNTYVMSHNVAKQLTLA